MLSTTIMRRRPRPTGREGGTQRSRAGTRLLGPVVLACAVVGALLAQTGVASAASRGFDIHNLTRDTTTTIARDLRLQSVQKVKEGCVQLPERCAPNFLLFDFEGRPHQGDLLRPTPFPLLVPHRFEIKWFLGNRYGAEATYNIEGTNAQLQVTMVTNGQLPGGNVSTCRILHAPIGSCTAGFQTITYR
jgi:hypothetical protein